MSLGDVGHVSGRTIEGLNVQVTTLDEVRTLIFGEAWHDMMLMTWMNF